jgi:hypothetical protein
MSSVGEGGFVFLTGNLEVVFELFPTWSDFTADVGCGGIGSSDLLMM